MNQKLFTETIAEKLRLHNWQIENTVTLLTEGATIPFISRYRKEKTGSLDEINIQTIKEEFHKHEKLGKRKESILNSIEKQGKLSPELKTKIISTINVADLEDIYLPFKQKKRTKATIARELGLEPLAKNIFFQSNFNVELKAEEFLSDKVENIEYALQGARDIIAEWINEDQIARAKIRKLFNDTTKIYSKVIRGKEEDGKKYEDYFDSREPLKKCSSHRILAMRRGEKEGYLRITIEPDENEALYILNKHFLKGNNEAARQVKIAVKDSYIRLLKNSIETEFKSSSKEYADEEAIKVFANNLRQLILASPLGQKRILAIDPAYRTGCKIVCLDEQGDLLHNETIFPHPPQSETKKAAHKISSLVNSYKIEAIAIGNGTASRETEYFIRKKIKFKDDIKVFVVNESGASVYSASSVAREEFPEYDVTVRGAISIGRRLMDPLAELVKIDPKSIGVGQYQHDVNQNKLKKSLVQIVESCVNLVGVNLNTASKYLLTFVSGLSQTIAHNIIKYRNENGAFKSREELKNIPRMGDKAYEQCAGFLRIENADNLLDNSAVHPESYHIVEKMANNQNCSINDLLNDKNKRSAIKLDQYLNDKTGLPTLKDIIEELAKPGRDPRTKISAFEFADGIYSIEDLKPGRILPGIVTNITKFGAFIDIGVKQDGLVHISKIKEEFVKDPADVLYLNQHVQVKVTDVDITRKRIQLTMIGIEQPRYIRKQKSTL